MKIKLGLTIFSGMLILSACEKKEEEPLPDNTSEITPTPPRESNIINKGPSYSLLNSLTNSGVSNKLFPGFYYTLEKASAQKLQVNERSLIDADYRFWDPSKCYLDYNQDGFLDMFAFLTNFKDAPYGSNFGKFLLVDDVLGPNPKLKYIDANRKFGPRLKAIDLNKDGVFEVLFSAEEDHALINGSNGKPAPIQFVQISKSGDLIVKEIGESVSIHGQGFGDVDNDGDLDILVWRFRITNANQENLANMPILYLNNGGNNFSQTNSFERFIGLENLIPILPTGLRKNYTGTAIDLFDIDGDGNLDILASYTHNQTVPDWEYNHPATRIYWGKGTGYFDFEKGFTDLPTSYLEGLSIPNTTNVTPLGFSYLDYDKDGDVDIITSSTANYGGYLVQLCENQGNRVFEDVTKQKFDTYSSIFPRGTQPQGAFPNFYEMRIHDKDGDGDFDLVPDHVATWDIWQIPISQNLYWENSGGKFTLKK